jgi:uncharacterized membrane protein YeaQ/YmgE (transglycosylase-associated protein family)
MLGTLIMGLLAGWLAGKLMRGAGYGVIADILLGLVGSVIGSWIFHALNIPVHRGIGMLAMATVGAVALVAVAHAIRREL